ncbi:hypothetical protein DL96DRAFT_1597113 [Flagelloscypha sp. PMI_526]|nr:hypothetical protein DL96DRAFT_1597113 [Flagelloscypha sp. PMI_526]
MLNISRGLVSRASTLLTRQTWMRRYSQAPQPSWDDLYVPVQPDPVHPSSNEHLVRLVALRQYPAAESLRQHMVDYGEPVTSHKIYEQAAVNALSYKTSSERLEGLLRWLALYPNLREYMIMSSHGLKEPKPLKQIRLVIFQSGIPRQNMHFILPVSLVIARKGYFFLIRHSLHHLLQHASQDDGLQFFMQLERARLAWDVQNGLTNRTLQRQRQQHYRQESILECCHYAWSDAALALCERASPTFRLNSTTRDKLIAYFLKAKDFERADRVDMISSKADPYDFPAFVSHGKYGYPYPAWSMVPAPT